MVLKKALPEESFVQTSPEGFLMPQQLSRGRDRLCDAPELVQVEAGLLSAETQVLRACNVFLNALPPVMQSLV